VGQKANLMNGSPGQVESAALGVGLPRYLRHCAKPLLRDAGRLDQRNGTT
jgi:hypothetical protein